MKILWLDSKTVILSLTVTSAIPLTTIQCSDLYLWLCKDSLLWGLTEIFLTKNLVSKQDENKFIKIGKHKNYYIYQTKCKVGECFMFNKKLLHNVNSPKKNFSRISIDIRIIDKKNVNLKKFYKNYYNPREIFRPNKFLDITKIDSEVKKFKYQNPSSLLQIDY